MPAIFLRIAQTGGIFRLPLANFAPGTPIFAGFVNEQGQQVLGLVDQALATLGVPFDARRANYDLSPEHTPQINLRETQLRLDTAIRAIAAEAGLTDLQTAATPAIAAAFLIQQCAGFLDPHVACVVAAYGIVEPSKTVPFDVELTAATGRHVA